MLLPSGVADAFLVGQGARRSVVYEALAEDREKIDGGDKRRPSVLQ